MPTTADDFTLTVQPCDNGFLVRCGARVEVVEEADREDGEADATRRLLYVILDMLDRRGTKHDAYRVLIDVAKQDSGELAE
jgi:hypothetical protein